MIASHLWSLDIYSPTWSISLWTAEAPETAPVSESQTTSHSFPKEARAKKADWSSRSCVAGRLPLSAPVSSALSGTRFREHKHTHPQGAHAHPYPPPPPSPRLNKLIKEGAALTGNLIKYDIPALKSMLTKQKYDGTLSEEIVTALVHDSRPCSYALVLLYQPSNTTRPVFQGRFYRTKNAIRSRFQGLSVT